VYTRVYISRDRLYLNFGDTLKEYLILGTSHTSQDSLQLESSAVALIDKYKISLVAEEYPCDDKSRVCAMAARRHIPYLQVDLFPDEWSAHGIDWEMRTRSNAPCLQGIDVRLSHADSVREHFWLDKVESALGRALIICGYLHLDFLAGSIRAGGGIVVDKCAFPSSLLGTTPTLTLSPDELTKYLREHCDVDQI